MTVPEGGAFSLVLVSPDGKQTTLADKPDIERGLDAVDVDGFEVVVRRRNQDGELQETRFGIRW